MAYFRKISLLCLLLCASLVGCGTPTLNTTEITKSTGTLSVQGEVWADNWFALYLGETLLIEDSVPITTERSFNAERFTFKADYPLVLNFVIKDYKANDTGLEYIGQGNQQMGDGGMIAQFTDINTGQIIVVSNASWKCLVIHEAPLDKSCEKESNPVAGQGPCAFKSIEEPAGWKKADFDDSAWSPATVYSSAQVSPKDGYNQISWDNNAKLIWTSDLETHNTILCRTVIQKP